MGELERGRSSGRIFRIFLPLMEVDDSPTGTQFNCFVNLLIDCCIVIVMSIFYRSLWTDPIIFVHFITASHSNGIYSGSASIQ